jgi:hypothetical protein
MAPDDVTDDFETVIQNPAEYYRHPSEIVDDPRLKDAERLRLLEEWHMDISNKLSADEEGMTPPHARDSANDAVILEKIALARTQIDAVDPEGEGVMAAIKRIWHRL